MKTRYKFIHFVQVGGRWNCRMNKGGGLLGEVGPGDFKKVAFRPECYTEFSDNCLADIIHFMGQLATRKAKPKDSLF